MLIVTLGVGISCLSRKSREWREYTLEDLDEWYYSKYPEKKRAQNLDPKSRMYIDPNGYRRYSDSHRLVHIHVAEVFVVNGNFDAMKWSITSMGRTWTTDLRTCRS
jgi:hypothetical protein